MPLSKGNDKINVLVVDDSAFMRKVVSDILKSDRDINVVDTAKTGIEALEKIKKLNLDVITMDIEMPDMDGLTCLKEILSYKFIPVIMVSSHTRDGAENTIRALEYGAVDFIAKPTNIFETAEKKQRELIEKIKVAKNSTGIRRNAKIDLNKSIQIKQKNDIVRSSELKYIVAIGSSTGGPRALQDVIPKIPGNIPAAFIIVQHMPKGFTKSLAERLDVLSELTVKEAEDGEELRSGCAYIAPGDYHLKIAKNKENVYITKLTKDSPVGGHRPSVNVMLESLALIDFKNLIGVIMTGMGGDGSEGIKKIKLASLGHIIAQDEKSCVVFGMPKTAIQTGLVDEIVPLKEIATAIMKNVGVQA
jgi:two-component system chemotaxis response regulator CheB